MIYRLEITLSAKQGMASLPKDALRRIDSRILALSHDLYPPGARKIQGIPDLYRIRAGDYRIVYKLEHARQVVIIVRVGHRREVYRRL